MRGKTISGHYLTTSSIVLLCLLLSVFAFSCREKTEEAVSEEQTQQLVFNLDEISVFDMDELSRDFLRGQHTYCKDRHYGLVKHPVFKSEKPLYGRIRFAGRAAGGPAPGGYHFALDESAGTGRGYDRFYFDHNCDLDLTNEKPLKPLKNPPDSALLKYSSIKQQICFDYLKVNFDFGSVGIHALEMMPRLMIRQDGRSELSFIATKVRKSQIDIEGARYDALIGYTYLIGRPLDQPSTVFYLIPKHNPQFPTLGWSGDNLRTMRAIGGKYYSFATTPVGDKLFARPYDGALGIFEVGAGKRNVQEISIQGSLRSEDTTVVVRGELERGSPKPVKSCRLPVGDYLPSMVSVTLGRLSIRVSDNYHADGKPRGKDFRNSIYGIKIREDKPYVFDFSNKPEVMFVLPAKNHRVKLGGELEVEAVLIDPELDIMIRRLEDTTRRQKKEFLSSDGRKLTYSRNMQLDPRVIITRLDGEEVAKGVMPFG